MKVHILYHGPSGRNFYFASDPRKKPVAELYASLKEAGLESEASMEAFEAHLSKKEKLNGDEIESIRENKRKFQEKFYEWLRSLTFDDFCNEEVFFHSTENLID